MEAYFGNTLGTSTTSGHLDDDLKTPCLQKSVVGAKAVNLKMSSGLI